MTQIERLKIRREEQLKDWRAYRQALIHRREEIETKISAVENQIKDLRNTRIPEVA